VRNIRWRRVTNLSIAAIFSFGLMLPIFWVGLFLRWVVLPPCNPIAPIEGIAEFPLADRLKTTDGLILDTLYYPTDNGAAVIILGGSGGLAAHNLHQARFLHQAGYGLLFIDNRPCATPRGLQTVGYRESRDFNLAVNYLVAEQRIEPGRLGVLGWSMGGATAVLGSANAPEIGAVVAEGFFSNFGENVLPPDADFWETISAFPLIWSFQWVTGVDPYAIDPASAVVALQPRPVFLMYGEFETDTSVEAMFPFVDQVWIVPGGSHGANYDLFRDEYTHRVLAFFDQFLLAH
jgi:pimeloyl-ACP methyl ester carboxylesterase